MVARFPGPPGSGRPCGRERQECVGIDQGSSDEQTGSSWNQRSANRMNGQKKTPPEGSLERHEQRDQTKTIPFAPNPPAAVWKRRSVEE